MAKPLYLICLAFSFALAVQAQTAAVKTKPITSAEKMIRAAYAKLELYNRAAELKSMGGAAKKVRDDSVLKFELKNFHTGPLDEIKHLHTSELISLPVGDVIQVSSGTFTLNDGPPEAYYSARWSKEPKVSRSLDWNVGELLQLLATEYFDVGHYTSYEVVVSFEGKTRSYKASVFHHDLGERAVEPKLTFWDSIGAGNRLADVLAEELPPYGTGASKALTTPE